MANIPEHHFTEDQILEFCGLLGTTPAELNPKIRQDYLLGPGRYFLSSLVQQNYPSSSQIANSLKKIESAASRLRSYLSDQFAIPYMRFSAGDVADNDCTLDTATGAVDNLKRWAQAAQERIRRSDELERRDDAEREAIGQAIAEANARGERKATPKAIAEARDRARLVDTTKRKAKGKGKGKAKRTAMRVLIHNLGVLWLNTHNGNRPTVSVKLDGTAGGKFIQFAHSYINAIRNLTTDEHRRYAKNIDEELDVSADAIAAHLRIFTARLPRRN